MGIMPQLEDPESWDCDCYDGIEKKCKTIESHPDYTMEKCMRAIICQWDRICDTWAEQQCRDGYIERLQQAMTDAALLQRAASRKMYYSAEEVSVEKNTRRAATSELDKTMGEKQCV